MGFRGQVLTISGIYDTLDRFGQSSHFREKELIVGFEWLGETRSTLARVLV